MVFKQCPLEIHFSYESQFFSVYKVFTYELHIKQVSGLRKILAVGHEGERKMQDKGL